MTKSGTQAAIFTFLAVIAAEVAIRKTPIGQLLK